MVQIYDVAPGSFADRSGILRGDYLVRINGNDINDVLDYKYYMTEKKVDLLIHRGPDLLEIRITKPMYADIGLDFETFLMDEKRSCRNKCIFCFIDQLPPGLRETLYFKDDDSRLSFLQGNYITMTNMSEADISRIIRMKTSPMNISVHTTNPELRVRMMNNRFAGAVLGIMKRFAEAGIDMNAQIVLCRGVNDGAELHRTMSDLETLLPALKSVSVVPAGLTKYRENLFPLEPFTAEECARVIEQVTAYGDYCRSKYGTRLFFCSDEFYIKAGLPIPRDEDYEGYPQLENGVGMIRSMKTEFDEELEYIADNDLYRRRDISIATGEAAYKFISSCVRKVKEKCFDSFECNVYKIHNDFFGDNITVAGLITGRDLYRQLRGKHLGSRLLLPKVMLRHDGDLFLDGMSAYELENKLGVKCEFIPNDGAALFKALMK